MSKKITMEYNEYLEWQDKLKKYDELIRAFKDEGKCLFIYAWMSIYDSDCVEILYIPDAVRQIIKHMSIKKFKELKKEQIK